MRKILTFIFCFFLAATVCAQDSVTYQVNFKKYLSIDSLVKMSFLLVVDGVPTADKPLFTNVLTVDVLEDVDYSKFANMAEAPHIGFIIITTKASAIAAYKKRISSFSLKYKDYLLSHQDDDNDILYVISNGKNSVNGSSVELLKELYAIQVKKIKEFRFFEKRNTATRFSHFAIIITKQ
jgi:hypothetical protein